jgi:3-oxoacyl-[acyl-carrier protein] reductase
MDLALNGRTALVTGGATGIGAAIALGLAREGGAVAVVDRNAPAGTTDILRELEAMGCAGRAYAADVRDHAVAAQVVGNVVRDFGRLDILVSNAGVTADAMIWRMTEAQWDDVLDVNLKGCFNYNQAAALVFKEQKGGRIVNIASINGLRGKMGQANYAASKGGVISFSKTLARELGKFNVNVNVVAPGMVLTGMSRGLPPEVLEAALDETLLGRLATPEDCANLVVFLCSDRACHITGEVMRVDGGQYV